MNKEEFKRLTETWNEENGRLISDEAGLPSVMVPLRKMKSAELHPELPDRTHPAWIVNGKEAETVWVSKYENVIVDGRAYSLPGQAPATHISFDEAVEACRKKGRGWGLMPASLWAAIALWCKRNQCLPHGNNNYGEDIYDSSQKGEGAVFSAFRPDSILLTKTGSGPAAWSHNGKEDGIYDLNGNVFEWQAGLRTVKGEIQVIPNADCMDPGVSLDADSRAWKAFDINGELISPDREKSLKTDFGGVFGAAYIWKAGPHLDSQMNTARYCEFRNMKAELPKVPDSLKELILFPADAPDSYLKDYFYTANLLEEGIAMRGGSFASERIAGMFTTGMNMKRTDRSLHIGFRSVYYEL